MTRWMLSRPALGLCVVLLMGGLQLGPAYETAAMAESQLGPHYAAITDARLRAHVKFLADDLLEGRAPSTRGGNLAANYIAAQFKMIGLLPGAANGSYFQMVTAVEAKVDAPAGVDVSGADGTEHLTTGTDVVAFTTTEDADIAVDADLVFVGYGINAPEQKWNDYQGIDVRGKVVLVMVSDPPATASEPNLFGGRALTYYGRWTYKFEEAARQGAAGAILIHTTESASYPWSVVQNAWSGTQYALPVEPGEPVLKLDGWVTDSAAHRIVARAGKNLDDLRRAAATRGFVAVPLGLRVKANMHQTTARKQTPNVIGVLPGANTSQAVLYTAHYDHFGIRDPKPDDLPDADRIFNGAVDNASGVAGILAIAQAFGQAGAKPGRSVYFIATTLEESGLLGSQYLAVHPMIPIDQMAADINIDSLNVLGATSDIAVLGTERSTLGPTLAAIVKAQGRTLTGDVEPSAGHFFRSDHFPFAKAGVPAVSISDPERYIGKDPAFAKKQRDDYTNKRYHQPSDEYRDSWDLAGAIADLKALATLGWQVAAAPGLPRYNRGEQFAAPRQRAQD